MLLSKTANRGIVFHLPPPHRLYRVIVTSTGGVSATCVRELWWLSAVAGRIVESTGEKDKWSKRAQRGPGGTQPSPDLVIHNCTAGTSRGMWFSLLTRFIERKEVRSGKSNHKGHYFAGMPFVSLAFSSKKMNTYK